MSYEELLVDADKHYVLRILENGDEELHFRNKPVNPLLKTLNAMGFIDHPDNEFVLVRGCKEKAN